MQLRLFSTDLADPGVNQTIRPNEKQLTIMEEDTRFCVLGSGSGGNASVLQVGEHGLLIDAGFGPVTTARRLRQVQLSLKHIHAVCLTHLDRDHFRPTWFNTLTRARIHLWLHRFHFEDFKRIPGSLPVCRSGLVHCFDDTFEPLPGINATVVHLQHDRKGTCGFRLRTGAGDVGYATDLGHVPAPLIECFTGVNLLAIESNYDPQLQRGSGRPIFLQRRIMGQAGHLSNQQAFDAVCEIGRASAHGDPRHVVLLHRSRQCNDPAIIRELFAGEPGVMDRVHLTHQQSVSPWFNIIKRDAPRSAATSPR